MASVAASAEHDDQEAWVRDERDERATVITCHPLTMGCTIRTVDGLALGAMPGHAAVSTLDVSMLVAHHFVLRTRMRFGVDVGTAGSRAITAAARRPASTCSQTRIV